MEREQNEEYLRLEKDAITRLRRGIHHKGYLRKVQALVLPSFEDCSSYELFAASSNSTDASLAVKTTWKRRDDLLRFQTPVARLKHGIAVQLAPTIEEAEHTTPGSRLNVLLEKATLLHLSPYASSKSIGLDGVSYEICFENSVAWSRFKWWESPPPGWEPLQDLFQEIESLVGSELHLNSR